MTGSTACNYLATAQRYLGEYAQVSAVREKLEAVIQTVHAYQERKIPAHPLPQLELSADLVFELLDSHSDVLEVDSFLSDLRQCVIENFGIWHIFSCEWITELKKYLGHRSVLEIMAGNGALASQLAKVIATDDLNWQGQDITQPEPWTQIENLDAMSAVEKYAAEVDVIIMEWSPDKDTIDLDILHFLRTFNWHGEFLVIGEKNGATNSKEFWQAADLTLVSSLNVFHQPFDFINDQVFSVK
ncbi:SAM-dependent methyltransferase [Ligilactobacillus pobuzihii]|uniref:SAM-dependent methyltransferase n=1 Tax=Ligilactobacillus pobuzihii TaxID=449659 RepID=UPI0019D0C4CD|nr:SAM-dependent methyltransferase [Ligilactobacillus pobuzihii]MBN7275051.1 SAM-dependent methyltransferase [Ligilactobacillus pobuzihii]